MAFSIRKAVAADAGYVLALFARAHVREGARGPPSVDAFLSALQREDQAQLLIERDGRPFGYAGYTIIDGWLMEIRALAFERQRTGAGRYTMEWLLHHAFETLRLHRAYLEVLEQNSAARILYEQLGLRQEGCFRDGYRGAAGSYHNLLPYGMTASEYNRRP